MRPFPVRPAPALALLVAGGATLAAAPSGAGAATFTPDCVKPGAVTNVLHTFDTTEGHVLTNAETILRPSVWRGGDGVVEIENDKYVLRLPRGPVTNAPDPTLPGYFTPTFTKADTVPATMKYDGLPIISYAASISPYGSDGTEYSNADTYGTVYVDLKRALMMEKTVQVQKRSKGVMTNMLVTGFRKSVVYAHPISRGKVLRHQKLGKSKGPSPCGQSFESVTVDGAKPGTLKIVFNTSKKSAKGGVSATIKVKR